MKIRNKVCAVYDIEVFINCFHCTIFNTETNEITKFEVSERKNQMHELCKFFVTNDFYFIGYNNIHYDNPIINYCLEFFNSIDYDYRILCNSIFNLSRTITSKGDDNLEKWKRWKYATQFDTLDLLTMLYSTALRVSLKEMQITMHYSNVREFITDWERPLPLDQIDAMIEYNLNDVMSTNELLNRCINDINLRLSIEDEYGIKCLSKDGVNIGMEIIKVKYLEKTGLQWFQIKDLRSPMQYIPLKDVILPKISYSTPILQSLLERLKMAVVSPGRKGLEELFILDGVKISVGVGGIHSQNKPEIIIPKEDEVLLDCDAASLYPSLLIEYGFYPEHLGTEFLEVYRRIRDERIEAKHNGNKVKNETLKLSLNGLSGNLQSEFSWVYSPMAVMKIRMNGQLLLLKLAEMLITIGCKMIQYNTDGLFLICKKNKLDEYNQIIKEFEEFSLLTMETEEFEGMYQLAINDYFAIKKGFSKQLKLLENPDYARIISLSDKKHTTKTEIYKDFVKEKGCFITKVKLGKGLTPKVIPKAIQAYFLEDIPVNDFIQNHTDIKDFLMSEKTGKQWTVEYNNVTQQRTNRFYASTDGAYLWKWKLDKNIPSDIKGTFCGYSEYYTENEMKERLEKYEEYGGTRQYQNMLASSGVTILNQLDEKPISERKINYRYYLRETLKIIDELKPKQLSLFADF